MYLETKRIADNHEFYTLTPEETKDILHNYDEREALDAFYRNSARVIIRIVSKYRNIDKDLLTSAGYDGIVRCYKHLKRNPHKLKQYPYFHKNAYLWVSAAVNQFATKEQKKTNDLVDPVVFEYLKSVSGTEADYLLDEILSIFDQEDQKLLGLHLDGVKKRQGAVAMGLSMKEYTLKLGYIRDRVEQMLKDER